MTSRPEGAPVTALGSVVVVGASAAGLTAAETLRREGFAGKLTMIGAEAHAPYDRPPLSKQVLRGEWPPGRTALRPDSALRGLDAEWLLGTPAHRLDLARRHVELADGRQIPFSGLVVATGVRPRTLPFGGGLTGVYTLRGLDDATRLAAALRELPDLVVVGAGFLGAEAAAAARSLGCRVTVVDPLDAPLQRQLGSPVAARLVRLHRERGVEVRCGAAVAGFASRAGRVESVQLRDGTEIPARAVLVAIGSIPATQWLEGSGLTLGDGLQCDEFCQAAPGVVAAGDVASWQHPVLGRLRLEHRLNATEQGIAAGRALLGRGAALSPVPYFWTDHFDVRIQVYGRVVDDGEFTVLDGDPVNGAFAVAQRDATGRLCAVAGWNMPRQVRAARAKLAAEYHTPNAEAIR